MKKFLKLLLVLGTSFSIVNVILVVSFFNILSKM